LGFSVVSRRWRPWSVSTSWHFFTRVLMTGSR